MPVQKVSFGSLIAKKGTFMAYVYLSLAFQIAITAFVATYLRQHQSIFKEVHKYFLLWLILSLSLIMILSLVQLPTPIKFIVLCMFSFVMGLNSIAASKLVSEQLIKAVIVATFCLFIVMTLLGFGLAMLGINLGFLSYILLCALIGLLVAFVAMWFIPVQKTLYKTVLVIGITLFSIYIAYDTNVILQKEYSGDFISATINIYLDILNIFTEMIAFNQN